MIPKRLIYAWFGNSEKPSLIQKCIESWGKILPEYEIIELNENTCDISKYKYAQKAYEQKKWAFVADCMKIAYLYEYGGIVIDADVESLKPFPEEMLTHEAFTSCESSGKLISAVIAAKPKNIWINKILKYYKQHDFEFNPQKITNTVIIDNINKKWYQKTVGDIIYLHGNVAVYPADVLEAKEWFSGKTNITERTVCLHHYEGSWVK